MKEKIIIKGIKRKYSSVFLYISVSVFVIGIIACMVSFFFNNDRPTAIIAAALSLTVVLLISRCCTKTVLTVTDKRIYGKNDLGEYTVFMIDNISRIEIVNNNSIIVYSLQKNAAFSDIDNIDNVRKAINGLHFSIQNENFSESIRNLSELFRSGKISEEEYLKRKRKLLKL